MSLTTAASSILSFLRAGYPDGVPSQDYIPLLALLRRRLTDEEVLEVANGLISAEHADSTSAMRDAITRITSEPPRHEDVARVRAQLAHGGWPLAGLDDE